MVNIDQTAAFDLLVRMEGEQWRQTQRAHPDDVFGFAFWRRAWEAKISAGLRDVPAPLSSFAERATREPVISGAEGYRRYRVLPDGEIALECKGALPDIRHRASALGFRVLEGC